MFHDADCQRTVPELFLPSLTIFKDISKMYQQEIQNHKTPQCPPRRTANILALACPCVRPRARCQVA